MTKEDFERVFAEMHESAQKTIGEILADSPLRRLVSDLRELKTPHSVPNEQEEGNK